MAVSLQDVGESDQVRVMWLDGSLQPLAKPVLLRMPGNDAAANEKFANDLVKILSDPNRETHAASLDPSDSYFLARLAVSCDTLPSLEGREVADMAAGPEGMWVLQFKTSEAASECADYLRTCPGVRYVAPDGAFQVKGSEMESYAVLSDISSHLSWGVEACGIGEYAESLIRRGITGGVTVAVIDSGVDIDHPFLAERLLPGRAFLRNDFSYLDQFGHGTHVA